VKGDAVTTDQETGGEPGPEVAAEGGTPEVAPSEFFRKIYQFFYSKTLGVVLLLAMAVYILLGALITQASPGTYDDPERKADFLAQMAERYGRISSLFDGLGFFHLFSSVGFLVLMGLLALSITACTVHRLPNLWRRARHPLTHATDRLFTQARYHAQVHAPGSTDDFDQVKAVLKQKRLRVLPDPKNPRALYADRFAWGPFGTVAAHLAFLIIIAAFLVTSATSINSRLQLPVGGDPVALGHGTGLTVQADSFDAPINEDGRALDFVSHLVVQRGDEVVKTQDVRVNAPLSVAGFRLHQEGYGLGIQMLATGPNDEVLFDGAVQLSAASENTMGGTFSLDSPKLQVFVYTPASGREISGLPPGSAAVELVSPGSFETLADKVLQPGEALVVGDYSFTFVRETQITIIQVRRDPGAIFIWIGSILLVGGMTVTFTRRHRRYWLRLTEAPDPSPRPDQPKAAAQGDSGDNIVPEQTPATPSRPVLQVASTDKQDFGFRRQFDTLVADLATALSQEKGEKP